MKENLYRILALLVVLTTVVGLAACAPTAAPEPTETPAATQVPEQQPTEAPAATEAPVVEEEGPVILRVGVLSDIDCWNPYACAGVWFWTHLVIEGLTDHGPVSEGCAGVPRLAESWEVSDDGRTWTIKLHEGITFSDGTPVTAETIKEFMEWMSSSEVMAEWFAETLSMESIEVVDDLTLQYTTTDPIINSPDYDWAWWYQLQPEVWTQLSEDEIFTYEFYPPIGTGPYVVTEHMPGDYIIYDARPDYYQGKPPIDRVVLQIYGNADAIVSALLAGEIDLTTPWMPPESYDILSSGADVTVEEKPPYAGTMHWLVFNMHPEGNKHPAVDDPAVREAIDYAINKEQIVEVALLGHGVTCPTAWACIAGEEVSPDLEVTPFDLDRANQILDDAGYQDTDGDGIRETVDGEPLEFRLLYQIESAPGLTIGQLVSDQLRQIGIEVMVESQEFGTWISSVLDARDFDIALDSETHDIDPASMDFWFSCWSADSGSAALNYPGYCNETMDELVYEYWFSTDLEARWEPMYEAQQILAEERPIITLAGQNSIQAYRSDRFEFPMGTCDVAFGMFDPLGLLNAEVK